MSVASIPRALEYSNGNNKDGHNIISHRSDRKGSTITNILTNNLDDAKSGDLWRAGVAEYLGTGLLVFFGVAVGMSHEDQPPVALLQVAIGIGFIVAVLITALTTVSGGHINPAISMGFLVSNQITFVRFVVYTVFQVLGSITAVGLLEAILPSSHHGNLGLLLPAGEVTEGRAVCVEMIITGTLIFVTLAMVDKNRTDVSGSVPLMVGLTVCANILIAGNLTGGCMNPARATGSAVMVKNSDRLWIYWVAPLLGSAIAGLLYDNVFSTRPLSIIARCVSVGSNRKTNKEAELPLNDVDVDEYVSKDKA